MEDLISRVTKPAARSIGLPIRVAATAPDVYVELYSSLYSFNRLDIPLEHLNLQRRHTIFAGGTNACVVAVMTSGLIDTRSPRPVQGVLGTFQKLE